MQFDDIIGNNIALKIMKSYLIDKKMPNILISGPNGCGKKTLVTLFLNEYYKNISDNISQYYLEIYGCIDTGKNILSEFENKKTSSSKTNISLFISKHMDLPNDKTRIIVIYDFDKMTNPAQFLLKSMIENKAYRVRFIFVCNSTENINIALQSRVISIVMQSISYDTMFNYIKKNTEYNDDICNLLTIMSNGNIKKCINTIYVFNNCNDKSVENFCNIFSIPDINYICKILKSKNIEESIDLMNKLIFNYSNSSDIIETIFQVIKNIKDEHINMYNSSDLIELKKISNNMKIISYLESILNFLKVNTITETKSNNIFLYKMCVDFINS